jgi:hypothetical protein
MFKHLDGSFHLAFDDQIFPALDLSFTAGGWNAVAADMGDSLNS